MNNNLVRMSGQFWKVSVDSKDQITLVSTILGIKTILSFKDFMSQVILGRIQTMGGI